jgi:hypothetical protein
MDGMTALGRADAEAPDAAEQAWGDTIHRLATVHQVRRELDAAIRWPLRHACTHEHPGKVPVLGSDPLDGETGGRGLNGARFAHHAFCCRALR